MKPEAIELNGKKVTLENITLEDIEQLFDFDKTVLLQHRLELANEYIETHFPENEKLFKKLQKSIKRNIKLTDPKTFKNVVDTPSFNKLLSVDYVNKIELPNKKIKIKNKNKKTVARFIKKPKVKSAMELIDEKIIELENEMKKTGMDT
jgi:hypothetical protein